MNKIIEIYSNNKSRPFDKIIGLLTDDQIKTLQNEFNHSDPRACLYTLKQRLLGFEIQLRCPICNKEISEKQYSRLHVRSGLSKRSCGSKECKKLYKEKCVFEKYGVNHISELNSVQESKRKTCQERYGVDNPAKSNIIREKMKKTTFERYGVENYRNSDEYLDKANRTCQEKYGLNLNWISSQSWFRDKVKKTNLEKFGAESATRNEDVKNKIRQTNLEKYGVEWFTQTDDFQKFVKEANLKKYGVEYTMQSSEVLQIIKQNNLEKYGVEWYFQQEEFKDNFRNYFLELYGVQNPMKIKSISEKVKQTTIEKYGCFPVPQKVYANFQKVELDIFNYIKSFNNDFSIIKNDRKVLKGLELDIYIPELKLAIEVNGDYWHSNIYKIKNYHINKTNLCKSKGIRLIHIWEHEWHQNKEFIQSLLKLYIEDKIHQNEFQKLLEQFNGKLPRDYFQILDFPDGKIEEPKEELINEHLITKSGFILER